MRGLYKDLVCLLQSDRQLHEQELKSKNEQSANGDRLVYRTRGSNNTTYIEMREYMTGVHRVEYTFVTRCYNETIEFVLQEWERRGVYPDIVIMNSWLWDVSRCAIGHLKH